MSRVVKTNFLILLVLRDNNSCFLSQESPAGFFIFHLFEVFRFSLSRLFPCFTFLGYFQVSPFSGVLIFHLSRMFSLFIFLRYFIFHLSQVLLCCCTASPTDLREHLLLPGVFTLHSFPPFGTTCFFFQGFPGSRQSFLEVCRIFHWCSKHKPGPSVSLNHTVFIKSSTEHYINLFQILNPLFNSYRYF